MRRLAMTVEYDGTDYSGFQFQKNAPSVQRRLESAIHGLTGETVRVKAAGRTDAGVHALGQVVAFDTRTPYTPTAVRAALNARLPDDVAVKTVRAAPPGFDPRRDAISRTYRYALLVSAVRSPLRRRTASVIKTAPDLDAMRAAAALMVGTRDFSNFGTPPSPGGSAVRRVDRVDITQDGATILIEVEGSSFLTRQVRRMSGALLDAGGGRLTIEDVKHQISGDEGAPPARAMPPMGLCLLKVRYAGFSPEQDE